MACKPGLHVLSDRLAGLLNRQLPLLGTPLGAETPLLAERFRLIWPSPKSLA